jgi:hypothetical protein
MPRPYVIQNPYKNTSEPGNRLIGYDELQDAIRGVFKSPCRVCATTNLAGTYEATTKTLTTSNPGDNFAIDGITILANDRVLVVGQTDTTQNGIYTVTSAGPASTPCILTRALDFNSSSKVFDGAKVWVGQGAVYADTSWAVTTDDPFILDTTAIDFIQEQVVAASNVTCKVGILAATGTPGEYTFAHNLNDPYPIVQIYNTVTDAVELADVELTDANTVTIRFATAPANSADYKIIVHGQSQS